MSFSLVLDRQMKNIGCTAKELAYVSGLSAATISRYRSGDREPAKDSIQLESLISALENLAESSGLEDTKAIREELEASLGEEKTEKESSFDVRSFRFNFALMLDKLSISMNDMAQALGYDTSYLSRICAGKRTPADPEGFVADSVNYVLRTRSGWEYEERLAGLLGCSISEIKDVANANERLYGWLYCDSESPRRYAERFLGILDSFDIHEYIKENRVSENSGFDEKDVSGSLMEVSYGLAYAPAAIKNFIRRAIALYPDKRLTICWNFPQKADPGSENFSLADITARMTVSGLKIRLIHCGADSAGDMLGWMSHWLPLYLSGQIEPYHLDAGREQIFQNAFLLSEGELLQMEAVSGHADRGRIIYSKEKDDLVYYQRQAEDLISLSEKAIEVIGANGIERRFDFLNDDASTPGKRKTLLSTPPTYTASPELLDDLFRRNKIQPADQRQIRDYVERERNRVLQIMKHSEQEDHIPYITGEEYEKNPIHLSLSGLFYEKDLFYTYEEYMRHVEDTKQFEIDNRNYHLVLRQGMSFRNIQIFIHNGEWVMISKNKTPAAHFIIKNPGLIDSLEKMIEIYTRKN